MLYCACEQLAALSDDSDQSRRESLTKHRCDSCCCSDGRTFCSHLMAALSPRDLLTSSRAAHISQLHCHQAILLNQGTVA